MADFERLQAAVEAGDREAAVEITQAAIQHAIDNPRGIDYGLVDAAETRRLLDRLYGYEVSPVLWRRVNRGLSAGRVQSPTVRLIVERERERIAFVSADYWDIDDDGDGVEDVRDTDPVDRYSCRDIDRDDVTGDVAFMPYPCNFCILPIPQLETDTNSNMTQNVGYSGG